MAYLNWKNHELLPTHSPHSTLTTQLELTLTAELRDELARELAAVFAASSGAAHAPELKLDLPKKWTIFWQARGGTGKLQLAHPQLDEWVATVHLTAENGQKLARELAALGAGGALLVSTVAALGWGSNFELILKIA